MKHKNPFIDESAFEGEDKPTKSEDEVLMEQAKQNTEVKVVKTYMALGMVIGLAVGAVFGQFLLGKATTGMGMGMLVGLVAGACFHKKDEADQSEEKK